MTFSERVYVVTGAGSGIGEAAAKKLASNGATVVVADFDKRGGQRVTHDIHAMHGRAAFTETDVSEEADVEAMIKFAVTTFGRLDGAINNAGVAEPPQRLHETPTAEWDRIHTVDLRGLFLCMRPEIAHFLAHGGGVIVNTASIAGLKAVSGKGAYVAAKHGVVGLTKQAAIEYVNDNIRVNAVAPGAVATPQFRAHPQQEHDMDAGIHPGGRPAEPEEVASAMSWLLSDEASFVSGETLLVDAASLQH